jgi:hypothetical protein
MVLVLFSFIIFFFFDFFFLSFSYQDKTSTFDMDIDESLFDVAKAEAPNHVEAEDGGVAAEDIDESLFAAEASNDNNKDGLNNNNE